MKGSKGISILGFMVPIQILTTASTCLLGHQTGPVARSRSEDEDSDSQQLQKQTSHVADLSSTDAKQPN